MQNSSIQSCQYNGFSVPEKSYLNILFETLFSKSDKVTPYFYIKRPDIVRCKLSRMFSNGSGNLQVISDFDRTLSKCFNDDGQVNPTCHGIMESDPEITSEARNKLSMLKQTYGSLEFDKYIPHSLKNPYMLEWWDIAHRVITSCNVHRDTLKMTLYGSNFQLRDRVPDFMSTLNRHNIPMVIFSAGLGNIIEWILEKEGLLYENVKVASNFMKFNEKGLLVSFQSPCIHTFNKTFGGLALSDEDRSVFSKRRCIMLLGDSLFDHRMADGLIEEDIREDISESSTSVILKIGFLNEKIETLLDEYMNLYDIVLTSDGGFELPLEIVSCIIESEQPKRK
uniref:5'-nucleotidase n=1 Tax=Echinococcus granulosus TaxID=6210 RepID=A0A068WJ52_ECHGR|nr:cytosolic 5' nucleotidase III [Echinococcus granulosus]